MEKFHHVCFFPICFSIIRETNFRLTPLYCNFKTYSSNLSEEKQKETQESDAMLDINKLKTDLESITKEKQTLTDKSKEIEVYIY